MWLSREAFEALDLVSKTGGLLGIVLGTSIVSIVEIFVRAADIATRLIWPNKGPGPDSAEDADAAGDDEDGEDNPGHTFNFITLTRRCHCQFNSWRRRGRWWRRSGRCGGCRLEFPTDSCFRLYDSSNKDKQGLTGLCLMGSPGSLSVAVIDFFAEEDAEAARDEALEHAVPAIGARPVPPLHLTI